MAIDLHLQIPRCGTRPTGVESELAIFWKKMLRSFFFVTVGFVCSRWRSTVMRPRTSSTKPNAHPQNEENCPVAIYNLSHKNQLTTCSDFSSEMDQRSGDGRFGGRVEIIALNCRQGFPEFPNAAREECLCSEQDHPEIFSRRRSVRRKRKPRKRMRFLLKCALFAAPVCARP